LIKTTISQEAHKLQNHIPTKHVKL